MHDPLLQGFRLGPLCIEPVTGSVSGNGASAHLPSRAVEVLLCLARRPGELVTREELLATVWGDVHGRPEALSHAVSELRHGLGDCAGHPEFIQTVPRRGYRLIAEPMPLAGAPVQNAAPAAAWPFWEELMQRGVVQAGAAHLVVGWLLIQVADATFADLGMPPWGTAFVTYVVAAGFPVVIVLAWFLEFAEGRMSVDRGPPGAPGRGALRRNYLAIVGGYVVATAGVGVYQASVGISVPDARGTVAADELREALPVEPASIAVLRFLAIGERRDARIFSDGLAEDVLDRLARIPGLHVASRTDAWSLPADAGSDEVRRRLRVAWFLEGSVRLTGDDLRVAVQLINTDTGFHKVSRTFDRKLRNFMAVQKEITDLTVANLRVALPAAGPDVMPVTAGDTDLDAYVHYRRGREIFERPLTLELLDEAVGHFRTALDLDPEYAAAHAGLCRAWVDTFVIRGEGANIERAEKACATALASNPNLHMVYTALGTLYRETGRLADAQAAFEQALELNDQDVEAMQGLAFIFERQGRLDMAQAALGRAMRIQPGNWRIINTLGSLHFATGDYRQAAAEFRKVAYLDPDNWQVLGNLGGALAMAGDFMPAAEALERALEIGSEQILYSNLGTIYYYLGDFEQAVAIHRKALAADPNSNIVWLNLADALFFAGEEDEARTAFRRTAELSESRLGVNPGDVESLQAYAWANTMLGEPGEARRAMDRALDASPNDPYVYYYDALIRSRSGDDSGALESIEKAVAAGYPRAMLAAEPYLERFRSTARFANLLTKERNTASR